MAEVTIKNIGPIETASIPVPAKGGVVVLRGKQGCGKSTALRAVSILGGKSERSLSVRDGQRNGAVEFGGVKLSVSRARQARSGELEIDSIEGRFDLGRLIDPQIADEERADAARIKQLIALSDEAASTESYRAMIESLGLKVPEDGWPIEAVDALDVYSRIKRLCDREATQSAKQASALPAEKPTTPPVAVDVVAAQLEVERAIEHAGAVARAKKLREEQELARKAAVARLEKITAKANTTNINDAYIRAREAAEVVSRYQDQIAKLEEQLSVARAAIETATIAATAAANEYDSAKRFSEQLAAAREAVDAMGDAGPPITDKDVDAAVARVKDARRAHEDAVMEHQRMLSYGAQLAKYNRRLELTTESELWRQAAAKCETVLAASLPDSPLRIDGTRLVCKTDRSASEPYSELSHGERALIAIDIVAEHLTPGGLATISQEIWSGISPENQQRIHQKARERNVVIITADVQDSSLTIDVMD